MFAVFAFPRKESFFARICLGLLNYFIATLFVLFVLGISFSVMSTKSHLLPIYLLSLFLLFLFRFIAEKIPNLSGNLVSRRVAFLYCLPLSIAICVLTPALLALANTNSFELYLHAFLG